MLIAGASAGNRSTEDAPNWIWSAEQSTPVEHSPRPNRGAGMGSSVLKRLRVFVLAVAIGLAGVAAWALAAGRTAEPAAHAADAVPAPRVDFSAPFSSK